MRLACLIGAIFLLAPMATAQNVVATDGGRVYVDLLPLGDVDGDGRADLLRLDLIRPPSNDEDGVERFLARALSGADFGKVLWTHEAPEGHGLDSWYDVNGDGVLDLIQGTYGGSSTSDFLDAIVVGQSRVDFQFTGDLTILSGTDLSMLLRLETDSSIRWNDVYADPLYVDEVAQNSTGLYLGGANLILEGRTQRESQTASAMVASASTSDVDAILRFHPVGGTTTTIFFAADDRLASTPITPDLDGDGRLDFVVLDSLVRQGASVTGAPLRIIEPSVVAYTSDGNLLWRRDFPLLTGDVMQPVVLGDLDGDPGDEIAVTLRTSAPGQTSTYELHVLAGGSGATKTQRTGPLPMSLRPLGDIDGDGLEEALWTDFSKEVPVVHVVGLDLESRWSTPSDDALLFSNDGPGRRMVDWTGDGKGDIVFGREFDGGYSIRVTCSNSNCNTDISYDTYQFKLDVLLADGSTAWTQAFQGLLNFQDLPDLDGRGGYDFAVVHVAGDNKTIAKGDLRGSTVTLEVFAGEDGKSLLRVVLRDLDRAIERDGLPQVGLVALGDLDGRPGSELGVGLVDQSADYEDRSKEGIRQDWTIYSLAAGKPIAKLAAPKAAAEAGQDPGPDAGSVLQSPDLVDERDGSQQAPVPLLVPLAGLAIGLAVRRRR